MVTREMLVRWDAEDGLAPFRDEFDLPAGLVYLDGNSLGPLPRASTLRLRRVVDEEWGGALVAGWTDHGWIDLPRTLGAKIGPLVGARPQDVLVVDSTSVNLFKLLAAGLALRPGRRVIVTEDENFPTDLYVAHGLAELLGRDVTVRRVARKDLATALRADVAVLALTHVDFRSGFMHDMAALTCAAHEAGALALWDLSHSVGVVPVELAAWQVDLAVGCGYKYLNGGPGAPAFLYVSPEHQDRAASPLTGWLGHAEPFAFAQEFRPALGALRFACGTPPVLSMAALEPAVDMVSRAGITAIRTKSIALTELFLDLVEQRCSGCGLGVATPGEPERRGSHVSLRHPEGYAIKQALIARNVVGDFRAPDLIRFGFSPLIVRFVDVWDAVESLRAVIEGREYEQERFRIRGAVT